MSQPVLPDTTAADQAVRDVLQQQGWTLLPGRRLGSTVVTVVAQKEIKTAVGPKVASMYVSPAREDALNRLIEGDYQSEGRNILESRVQLLPIDASPDLARRIATRFAESVDLAIEASYAVGLLRSQAQHPSAEPSM